MKTKEILKNLRKKNGYSAQQVAEGCGMSLGVYKKYESGERGVGTPALCKLADFHGVTTDYLLGRDTTQPVEDVSKMSDNELDKKLMQFFMDLPENSKQGIRNFVLSIAHGLNEESPASKQQEESQQQQQAPEPPIVQSTPQNPPQPVKPPIVQQSNSQSQPNPAEQPPKIESTQSQWRFTARRTDGHYESRPATPEEVEKLKLLENDPEPEF